MGFSLDRLLDIASKTGELEGKEDDGEEGEKEKKEGEGEEGDEEDEELEYMEDEEETDYNNTYFDGGDEDGGDDDGDGKPPSPSKTFTHQPTDLLFSMLNIVEGATF